MLNLVCTAKWDSWGVGRNFRNRFPLPRRADAGAEERARSYLSRPQRPHICMRLWFAYALQQNTISSPSKRSPYAEYHGRVRRNGAFAIKFFTLHTEKGEDIGVGPDAAISAFLSAADRGIDRVRAKRRLDLVFKSAGRVSRVEYIKDFIKVSLFHFKT